MPYDCCVEITSIVKASGPKPISYGPFKPAERGILQLMKAMEEVTIEAAVTGNYGTALQAFTLNPLIPSVPWVRGWKRSWIPAIYPSALMSTVCLSRMRARAI